jgi:uncharacterized protein (UPF0335 family)
MSESERAAPGESGPPESSDDLLAGKINSLGSGLRTHFDRAVELLEQKTALLTDIAEWRGEARGDGLDSGVLLRLAREHLLDATQRRKTAERAATEKLYRNGLGLPLFDYARRAE